MRADTIGAHASIAGDFRLSAVMATHAQEPGSPEPDGTTDDGHDAFVRAKVRRGLEQSRDRGAMIPIEQVWRDLKR